MKNNNKILNTTINPKAIRSKREKDLRRPEKAMPKTTFEALLLIIALKVAMPIAVFETS